MFFFVCLFLFFCFFCLPSLIFPNQDLSNHYYCLFQFETIWLYDGNVDYLKGKHISLFIAAMLLLLISLPYTAILIFIQYLQHWSSYRVLFWVKKLKPLFDAYTGPYKDRHRYWAGLLLLVHIVLFLMFSIYILTSIFWQSLRMYVLSLLVYLATAGSVYKALYLDVIEYSFFFKPSVLVSTTCGYLLLPVQ